MCDRKRFLRFGMAGVLAGVCVLGFAGMAAAQQGGRGPAPLPPEQAARAHELEAQSVAQALGLSDELTTKLVDAWKASRESTAAAFRTQGGQGNRQTMLDAMKAEQTKLEASLKGFLNEEQTAKALGYFSPFVWRWDQMVLAIDDMNLEAEKEKQALVRVAEYVAASAKARESAMAGGGGDQRDMRQQMRDMRDKLDTDLGQILSAEQLAQWKEKTAMRGGERGGAGRGAGQAAPAPETAPKPAE